MPPVTARDAVPPDAGGYAGPGYTNTMPGLKPRPAAIADAAPPAEEASQAKDAGAEVKVEEKKAGGRKRKTKEESEPAKRARK